MITHLALEYKKHRDAGTLPVAALDRMRSWRERVTELLLARAESAGLPPDVQALVLELQCELRTLTATLGKVAGKGRVQ